MTELLSVNAEDVEAFCIYDTDNEVFIKAFRSSADVCKPLGEWVTLSDYACDSNIITVVRENGYDYSTYLNNKMEADILVDEVPTPKRRPYTQEEAVQLIGKILSYEYKGERITRSVFEVSARGSRVKVDRTNQATWMERNATIDGQPFGVLITD